MISYRKEMLQVDKLEIQHKYELEVERKKYRLKTLLDNYQHSILEIHEIIDLLNQFKKSSFTINSQNYRKYASIWYKKTFGTELLKRNEEKKFQQLFTIA
jgi:hypothetical protein